MNVSEVISGIREKQKAQGWTNQQLADASGVALSTITRIYRGETPNPSAQNIFDLAHAVGYKFEQDTHLPPIPADASADTAHLIAAYEHQIAMYERIMSRDEQSHNRLLAEKNRWIKLSLFLNILLVAFIIGILLYDIANTDVGWVREQLAGITQGIFRYFA